MRRPEYHIFAKHDRCWFDVYPGDIVVCPGKRFVRYADWDRRDEDKVRIVTVQTNPLLVLARIEQVVGAECPGDSPPGVSTFVMFSISKGIIVCTHPVKVEYIKEEYTI